MHWKFWRKKVPSEPEVPGWMKPPPPPVKSPEERLMPLPAHPPQDPGLIQVKRTVQILNRIFKADPNAIEELVRASVPCGIELACIDYVVNEDERATFFKVTAMGLLNGVLGDTTGYIVTVLVEDGRMKGFGYQKPTKPNGYSN